MAETPEQSAAGSKGSPPSKTWLDGRANRKEYWLLVGPLLVLSIGLSLCPIPQLHYIPDLGIFFVWIRRLHDIGWSGFIAPIINIATRVLGFGLTSFLAEDLAAIIHGLVVLAVLVALGAIRGEVSGNRYGEPPSRKRDMAEALS